MADLTVPVLRFRSSADLQRGIRALDDQQFEVRQESGTAISLIPWADLDEAHALLESQGIVCERGETVVPRLGPGRASPPETPS